MTETMTDNEQTCRSCSHVIDGAAKLCPYCGADPITGQKVDTRQLVESHFPPRPRQSIIEKAMQALRARQGVVVAAISLGALLLLIALHQFVSRRNDREMNEAPAVPLTEITDLQNQAAVPEQPLPDLPFFFDGNPKTMQTYLLEPGAVAPAPPATTTAPGASQARPAMPAPAAPQPR